MKINNFLSVSGKALRILKLYENSNLSLDEVLEDIYQKLKVSGFAQAQKEPIDISKVINEIRNLEKDEIIKLLSGYKKSGLIEIAEGIGLKVSKGQKSDIILETIANYFSFKNISDNMPNRDLNPNNFFEGQSNASESTMATIRKDSK